MNAGDLARSVNQARHGVLEELRADKTDVPRAAWSTLKDHVCQSFVDRIRSAFPETDTSVIIGACEIIASQWQDEELPG